MALTPLGPIHDAKDVQLDKQPGTLPLVTGGITDYMQQMTFTKVTKGVLDFDVQETPVSTTFFGCWQPFSTQQLLLKPEGQRAWHWYTLHAYPTVVLVVDEVIKFLGIQYRVMGKWDYITHGFVEYHLVEDWTGAGP